MVSDLRLIQAFLFFLVGDNAWMLRSSCRGRLYSSRGSVLLFGCFFHLPVFMVTQNAVHRVPSRKKEFTSLLLFPSALPYPHFALWNNTRRQQARGGRGKGREREKERRREGEKERKRERERERKRERIPVGLSNPLNERDNLLAVEGTVLL